MSSLFSTIEQAPPSLLNRGTQVSYILLPDFQERSSSTSWRMIYAISFRKAYFYNTKAYFYKTVLKITLNVRANMPSNSHNAYKRRETEDVILLFKAIFEYS